MSKSNVKSLNALSVKLGKDSDAVNKVGALKNIYAALSGKESKGIGFRRDRRNHNCCRKTTYVNYNNCEVWWIRYVLHRGNGKNSN